MPNFINDIYSSSPLAPTSYLQPHWESTCTHKVLSHLIQNTLGSLNTVFGLEYNRLTVNNLVPISQSQQLRS